jgi:GntR family transcriptional regulator/MocR family aminotransferase
MVVPEQLIDAFLAVRALIDAHPSSIAQAALVDFIGGGYLTAHIRRMRALYAERQAVLIAAIRERIGDRLALSPSAAGMHLVGRLAPHTDDRALALAAAAVGIETPALSSYYQGPAAARGLLLGYAGVPEPTVGPAVARLAGVIERAVRPAGAGPPVRV